MKGVAVLVGLISSALALHIPSNNRPAYEAADDGQLISGMDQRLDCYDSTNCNGIRITIGTTPVPDLAYSPYYFDNRIQSCLYNGIYMLYDGRNYNQDNLNVGTVIFKINLIQIWDIIEWMIVLMLKML